MNICVLPSQFSLGGKDQWGPPGTGGLCITAQLLSGNGLEGERSRGQYSLLLFPRSNSPWLGIDWWFFPLFPSFWGNCRHQCCVGKFHHIALQSSVPRAHVGLHSAKWVWELLLQSTCRVLHLQPHKLGCGCQLWYRPWKTCFSSTQHMKIPAPHALVAGTGFEVPYKGEALSTRQGEKRRWTSCGGNACTASSPVTISSSDFSKIFTAKNEHLCTP